LFRRFKAVQNLYLVKNNIRKLIMNIIEKQKYTETEICINGNYFNNAILEDEGEYITVYSISKYGNHKSAEYEIDDNSRKEITLGCSKREKYDRNIEENYDCDDCKYDKECKSFYGIKRNNLEDLRSHKFLDWKIKSAKVEHNII
jgi:hypothetical protein